LNQRFDQYDVVQTYLKRMADRANMQSQEDEVKSAAERLYSNDLCMDAIYAHVHDPDGNAPPPSQYHRSIRAYRYYLGRFFHHRDLSNIDDWLSYGDPEKYTTRLITPGTLWRVSLSDKEGYRRTAKYLYHTVPETMIRRMIESDHDPVSLILLTRV
jgi:hypothetical protein